MNWRSLSEGSGSRGIVLKSLRLILAARSFVIVGLGGGCVGELGGKAGLEEVGLIDSEIILPWAVW